MTKETPSSPRKIAPTQLRRDAKRCAVLIVAAGFEDRARRVLHILGTEPIPHIVLVRYAGAAPENENTFQAMLRLGTKNRLPVESVNFDLQKPDEYLSQLNATLTKWRPDSIGEVWVDVSAMAMQGICATLAAVRSTLPGLGVQVLYTEAAIYHPTKAEAAKGDAGAPALSKEMAGNLIPKHFAGAYSSVATCLIVFAGYEKHRSLGVVDELNPSRLVIVYGKPPGGEMIWRLHWSKKIHQQLHQSRPSASEIVSTLDPLETLRLLNMYYGYLFADHNIAVSPICSKMQCVGCYLFWERYRDVQLVFPLPVTYLPGSFSVRYGYTFRYTLPTTAELALLMNPSL